MPLATSLALAALLTNIHAHAGFQVGHASLKQSNVSRSQRALASTEPHGCLYAGRWHREGATVDTESSCLRCACGRGALACRRRACGVLPDPPPARCHVLHRKDACCPELHCPDGVIFTELSASARFESEEDFVTPSSVLHACVEGGTVFAAGSAMTSHVACEQCFCLRGARRCVRPRCLPAPVGCRARPAPGACCPQRYYCDRTKHAHDCVVSGEVIPEGERVTQAERGGNCTRCYCLRGVARCQPLACAATLHGCTPLLRQGECCPHQYHCQHSDHETSHSLGITSNSLVLSKSEDRSFHKSKAVKSETATKTTARTSVATTIHLTSNNKELLATTKVKRKTEEQNVTTTRQNQVTKATAAPTTKKLSITETKTIPDEISSTEGIVSSTEMTAEEVTLQPESSVRVVINGTINCTAELSSTSIPLNFTKHEIERIELEAMPRIPYADGNIETQTSYPNDIITDRSVNGNFDENETFTINVTSSLNTNKNNSGSKASKPSLFKVSPAAGKVDSVPTKNISKEDYDYDYNEPTLPPSLPNLKIIPFVAADAVVDEASKKPPPFTDIDRDDKFPIYYPNPSKETPFATRRQDVYIPSQSPTFTSIKDDTKPEPDNNEVYKTLNDLLSHREYTVSTSFGRKPDIVKTSTDNAQKPIPTFHEAIPNENKFSPPVETEGGFIPKGPGIIDEYYAVYPSTPGPLLPHLTTSMQLDVSSDFPGECTTSDGRRIPEGQSINVACSVCACAWGELHCSPRPCLTPPGCRRKPAASSTADLCCGELACDKVEKTTTRPKVSSTMKVTIKDTMKKETHKNTSTESPVANRTAPSITKINESHINDNINNDTNNADLNKVEASTIKNLYTTNKPESLTSPTITSTVATTTMSQSLQNENNETETSQEYEDEEDDEGFSFGSVLKLLLSETYDATTAPPHKRTTTVRIVPTTTKISTYQPISTTTTNKPNPKPPISFVPMPHHSYTPPKKVISQNTVDRIDHLVLGEATAINKAPPRPILNTFKPIPPRPVITTKRPLITTTRLITRHTTPKTTVSMTTKPSEMTRNPEETTKLYAPADLKPSGGGGFSVGGGLLKLAGCNIYGRMYRVGRIIAELSTPCSECWCTELGVQCRPLHC